MGAGGHTAGVPGADGAVGGVGRVTTDVAHARVVEPFAAEVLAVHVLDAPEAAGGDGGALGAFGDGCGRGHGCGLGEGAEQTGEEGHGREEGEEKDEDCKNIGKAK
jgi:hypothetical protein